MEYVHLLADFEELFDILFLGLSLKIGSLLVDFFANRYDVHGIFRNDAVPFNQLLYELGLNEVYEARKPLVVLISLIAQVI